MLRNHRLNMIASTLRLSDCQNMIDGNIFDGLSSPTGPDDFDFLDLVVITESKFQVNTVH